MKRSASLLFFALLVMVRLFCRAVISQASDGEAGGSNTITASPITIAPGDKGVLHVRVKRLKDNPVIRPNMDKRIGFNIKLSVISLSGDDYNILKEPPAVEVLRHGYAREGADQTLVQSLRSSDSVPVNQLRNPAIFQEDGRTFLLYATGG